jgi:hypothetical protein
MKPELSVVGIDLAKSLFHLVGLDERGKIISLNLSYFVARKIWRRRGVSSRRYRAHRL